MSFTDGKPWIATEKDCKGNWSCGENGKNFRCGLCGYKFKPGDKVRWQYTNDTGPESSGNPLVCKSCDGTKEEIVEKMKANYREFKKLKSGRMWIYIERECRR